MNTDWNKKYIGDLIDIRGGLSYKTSEIGSGEKKLLGMGCVSYDKRFLESGCRQFCGEGKSQHLVTPGDLVIATRQQSDNLPILGFPAQIPNKLSKEEIYVGTNLYKVENNSKYSNSFLYWLMRGNLYRQHVKANASGSTVRMITKDVILNFQFNCPSIQESIKIAECLDYFEDKIELNQQNNETLEDIAKALFKSWFIDFDPVKAKAEGLPTGLPDEISDLFPDSFEESVLGEIPAGWKIQYLQNISEISSGKRPRSRSETKTLLAKYPLYGGAGPMGFTNEFLIEGRKIITTGRVGTLGKFFRIKDPVWISDNALIIEPSNLFYNYCFYRLLNFDITIFNRGSTQPLITQSDLKKIEVICANEKIHKQFEILCSDFFEQFHKNQKESNTLGKIRDSLLPKLISGELRITDAEKMIEEAAI